MPDFDKVLDELKTKFKNKKAKVKSVDQVPTGTKNKKLPSQMVKGFKDLCKADLSNVRVHYGGNAADVAKSLGAQAFTVGNDIYVAKPAHAGDMKFLGHEMWHVVQQRSGRIKPAGNGKAYTTK